jgi:hypothetical protein
MRCSICGKMKCTARAVPTVGVYPPRLEMNIGYAIVPIGNAALDTRLDIAIPWGPVIGIVRALPFIKRR